jgi:uracil-DNA glycosylase
VAGTLPALFSFWDQLPKFLQELLNQNDLELVQQNIGSNFQPGIDNIFAAFKLPLNEIKVLIVGQDPYPNFGHAMGLAFSVPSSVKTLPPTLKNIFKELKNDLGIDRKNGDLTDWAEQGVMLLNRTLTIGKDGKPTHINLGWEIFTEKVIKSLADRGVLALLWGKEAEKISRLFPKNNFIATAHPSPLSAYRGFFGSKPFSKINKMLIADNQVPIRW